jgi:hypothetical protein
MAISAAKAFAYLYPEEEDPAGAFDFWLSPCGKTDLVPEDLKKIFDILSSVADGVGSWKSPKDGNKGSGKKGDDGNPNDRTKCKRAPGGCRSGSGAPPSKCKIPQRQQTRFLGAARNTLRMQSCVADKTVKVEMIITSLVYAANAQPTRVQKHCSQEWSQACFHYSSAIRVNPQWAVLTCPPSAATTSYRLDGFATNTWAAQHSGAKWTEAPYRQTPACDRDEWPPAYLLDESDPAYKNSGVDSSGQLVRYLPMGENRAAGQMWRGVCFNGPVRSLSEREFKDQVEQAPRNKKSVAKRPGLTRTFAAVTVSSRPEFTISSWGHSGSPPTDDGLRDNPCWPKAIAAKDPAFVLLTYDPRYGGKAPPYDYRKPYEQGSNGS